MFAEHERDQISARTKQALAAAKERGVKLGGPNIAEAARLGAAKNRTNADRFAVNTLPIIREIQASGVTSLRGVARALTARRRAERAGHSLVAGRGEQHHQAFEEDRAILRLPRHRPAQAGFFDLSQSGAPLWQRAGQRRDRCRRPPCLLRCKRLMFAGTCSLRVVCQPALSSARTAWAPAATQRLISSR